MLITQRPTIEEEIVDDTRSRFIVEPLEPGFGYTLGNTMRRTLLFPRPWRCDHIRSHRRRAA